MARQYTRGRGRLGAPRATSWLEVEFSTTNITAANILASLTTAEKAKRPFTIIRTRLEVQMTSDQAAATESQFGAIGLCVISDQASAIGVTAVPTPITDLASDLWLMHQVMFGEFLFGTAVGFQDLVGSSSSYSIDSKAARKVNDDEDVVFVAEADGVLGSGINLKIGGRVLIKEH